MKKIFFLAVLLLVAGCQVQSSSAEPTPKITADIPLEPTILSPEPCNTTSTPLPSDEPLAVAQARFDSSGILELVARDLAARLAIEPNAVQVLSIQQVEWANAGLGCPFPGKEYPQMVTPGYLITLSVSSRTYTYHTDNHLEFVLCGEKGPALPLIPIEDDLMDGIPWMPVDPIPTITKGEINSDPDPVK